MNELGLDEETNERLEFLGDAALSFVVAEKLYQLHPGMSEGQLTRARASLVSKRALALSARRLRIAEAIRLGKGALLGGGHRSDSVLSDALEAIIGAALLDGGLPACAAVVEACIDVSSPAATALLGDKDAKTLLQELTQKRQKAAPEYGVVTGPPAEEAYTVEVSVAGARLAVGSGGTKTAAGQKAARAALRRLQGAGEETAGD